MTQTSMLRPPKSSCLRKRKAGLKTQAICLSETSLRFKSWLGVLVYLLCCFAPGTEDRHEVKKR